LPLSLLASSDTDGFSSPGKSKKHVLYYPVLDVFAKTLVKGSVAFNNGSLSHHILLTKLLNEKLCNFYLFGSLNSPSCLSSCPGVTELGFPDGRLAVFSPALRAGAEPVNRDIVS
jgi:hypothetical protein